MVGHMCLTNAASFRQGLNTELYWKNPDARTYANIVPTSAITGEGGSCAARSTLQTMRCQRLCSAEAYCNFDCPVAAGCA